MTHRRSGFLQMLALGLISLFLLVSGRFDATAASTEGYPSVRTDIREAIVLGVSALNNSFDRDEDDEPFFYANRREDGTAEFRHWVRVGIPHGVGRCLWPAMLAEEIAGVSFPEEGLISIQREEGISATLNFIICVAGIGFRQALTARFV